MKTVIIGFGYVGRGMYKMFQEAVVYDPYVDSSEFPEVLFVSKKQVNDCDFAIICVPTNIAPDGWSCDLSVIDEVFSWLTVPLVLIKSTVEPGTTRRLQRAYSGDICFSPEYMGEGKYFVPFWRYPDPVNPKSHGFMIVGGRSVGRKKIVDIFAKIMGPHTVFYQVDSKTAETIKYVENMWGAMKVTFFNELYNCCEALHVDYRQVREGWALDGRVERMHSVVFPDARGFAGKCFPKDLRAFISAVKRAGYQPKLLEEVVSTNNRIRKQAGLELV